MSSAKSRTFCPGLKALTHNKCEELNPLKPCDPYLRQWTRTPLVQAPNMCQDITRANVDVLSIEPLGTSFNQTTTIFHRENTLENIVYKTAAILFRNQFHSDPFTTTWMTAETNSHRIKIQPKNRLRIGPQKMLTKVTI